MNYFVSCAFGTSKKEVGILPRGFTRGFTWLPLRGRHQGQILVIIGLLFLFAIRSPAEPAPYSLTKQYNMTLGGMASIPFDFDKSGNFRMGLDLRPEFGIFVVKGFLVSVGFAVSKVLMQKAPGQDTRYSDLGPVRWGPSIDLRYLFSTNSIAYPYIGAAGAFEFPDNSFKDFVVVAKLLIGVQFAVNEHLAVDTGIPIEFEATYYDLGTRVRIPVGYFGLRGVF